MVFASQLEGCGGSVPTVRFHVTYRYGAALAKSLIFNSTHKTDVQKVVALRCFNYIFRQGIVIVSFLLSALPGAL